MNLKEFTRYEIVIGAFVGALVGWSVATGNTVLLLVAVIVGLTFEYLCRRRVTEVIEDERIVRVSEKASRRSFQVFVATTGVVGAFLTTLGKSGYARFTQAGYTLAFSACSLLMLYLIFYGYYNRRSLD